MFFKSINFFPLSFLWDLVMAAYNWIVGIAGLFVAWIVMTVIGAAMGYISGVFDFAYGLLNSTGIYMPSEYVIVKNTIQQWFLTIWSWVGFITLISFVIYILISSMRKRPEDIYW